MNDLEKKAGVQMRSEVLEKTVPQAVNDEHKQKISTVSAHALLASNKLHNIGVNRVSAAVYYAASLLAGCKVKQDDVADMFDIQKVTLRKHYQKAVMLYNEITRFKWDELVCPDCGQKRMMPKASMSDISYQDGGNIKYERFVCLDCGEEKTWTVTFDV